MNIESTYEEGLEDIEGDDGYMHELVHTEYTQPGEYKEEDLEELDITTNHTTPLPRPPSRPKLLNLTTNDEEERMLQDMSANQCATTGSDTHVCVTTNTMPRTLSWSKLLDTTRANEEEKMVQNMPIIPNVQTDVCTGQLEVISRSPSRSNVLHPSTSREKSMDKMHGLIDKKRSQEELHNQTAAVRSNQPTSIGSNVCVVAHIQQLDSSSRIKDTDVVHQENSAASTLQEPVMNLREQTSHDGRDITTIESNSTDATTPDERTANTNEDSGTNVRRNTPLSLIVSASSQDLSVPTLGNLANSALQSTEPESTTDVSNQPRDPHSRVHCSVPIARNIKDNVSHAKESVSSNRRNVPACHRVVHGNAPPAHRGMPSKNSRDNIPQSSAPTTTKNLPRSTTTVRRVTRRITRPKAPTPGVGGKVSGDDESNNTEHSVSNSSTETSESNTGPSAAESPNAPVVLDLATAANLIMPCKVCSWVEDQSAQARNTCTKLTVQETKQDTNAHTSQPKLSESDHSRNGPNAPSKTSHTDIPNLSMSRELNVANEANNQEHKENRISVNSTNIAGSKDSVENNSTGTTVPSVFSRKNLGFTAAKTVYDMLNMNLPTVPLPCPTSARVSGMGPPPVPPRPPPPLPSDPSPSSSSVPPSPRSQSSPRVFDRVAPATTTTTTRCQSAVPPPRPPPPPSLKPRARSGSSTEHTYNS